jgi:hypothetical protein
MGVKVKPVDRDIIKSLLAAATAKQTKEEFKDNYLSSIHKIIKKDPLRYRSYGAHWWMLKKMLLDIGNTDFGLDIDENWVDALDTGNDITNLLGTYDYQEKIFRSGLLTSPTHQIEVYSDEDEGFELFTFYSNDEEMELRAVARSVEINTQKIF